MSEKKFDLLVFIGRFRPFHKGHMHVIDHALEQAHNVLVLVGSANRPRTAKTVWTADEVEDMIRSVYPHSSHAGGRLSVTQLDDWMHDNDFRWLMDVHRAVDAQVQQIQRWSGRTTPLRIGLVGYSKDKTSYYLKKFPQWKSIDAGAYTHESRVLDATAIRHALIHGADQLLTALAACENLLPRPVANCLYKWSLEDEHRQTLANLKQGIDFAVEYKEEHAYKGKRDPETGDYKGKPYNAIHTTADSVIIQSGHVLMGKRKFNPGKGLWALPGGFAHEFELISESSLRETKEETRIGVPLNTLKLAFRFKHVFGDPNRSDDRGRIITHAYLYLLNDREELPEVQADDDFEEVRWVPLGLIDPRECYSDHYWIIRKMIDMIPVD